MHLVIITNWLLTNCRSVFSSDDRFLDVVRCIANNAFADGNRFPVILR